MFGLSIPSSKLVRTIMRNECAAMIKVEGCPACGAMSSIRDRFDEMMVESPCTYAAPWCGGHAGTR